MAAALAAGDERVIKVAGLSGDIERLERLKGRSLRHAAQLRSERKRCAKFEIPRLEKRRAAMTRRQGSGQFEPFTVTDGKEVRARRKRASTSSPR
jgi:hypothetical protein